MARKVAEDTILNGTAKKKEIEELHKREWRYPARSCFKCANYKCFKGQDANRCNMARYGCIHYEEI